MNFKNLRSKKGGVETPPATWLWSILYKGIDTFLIGGCRNIPILIL
jgi:hypothetical protein